MSFGSATETLLEAKRRIESTIDDMENEIAGLKSALYEVDKMLKEIGNED
jgi:prefoldin subunit 5